MSLTANQLQEIQAGQAAINRRRAELAFCANGSRTQPNRPTPPEITPTEPQERPQRADQDKPTKYPQEVNFYALMGVHAAQRYSRIGGGWRLYVLAKALDGHGHGREAVGSVQTDDLREFALALGVIPRTYRRWYRQAVQAGLFDPVQSKSGAWRLILPCAGKAAHYMGADDIGRKVEMSAADLLGKGWKANVWAAFEAARGLQISRDRLEQMTGVPTSTQRYRDNQAGVQRTANYAQSDYKADHLPGLQELSDHKGLFVANNGRVYWRLPDKRTTDAATDAGRGRGRKAQSELNTLNEQDQDGALLEQRALSGDLAGEFIRILCKTPAQRRASERKVARQDNLHVTDIYQAVYTNETSGAGIWDTYGQI